MDTNRSTAIWGVTLLLVLSALACSFSGEVNLKDSATSHPDEGGTAEATNPPATVPPATSAPQPTQPPTTESSEPTLAPPGESSKSQDPLEIADIPELEDSDLDPRGEGLGHLSTFRQHMRASFTADDSGYTSAYQYDAEVNTANQAMYIILSVEGDAAMELPANTVEIIWIGTQMWVKAGRQPWMPVPEGVKALPFDEQVLAVGDFLPYVEHFDKVDERTMNDIPCAYYTYDADNVP
ncbi:MAG: hypothetical protein AB8I69_15445, partial [Anaerolineae bacterium]